jgi:hypothetical protein
LVGLQPPKHFRVIAILDEGFCFGHGGWVQVVKLMFLQLRNWRPQKEGEEREIQNEQTAGSRRQMDPLIIGGRSFFDGRT